jgi:hypothetical protein
MATIDSFIKVVQKIINEKTDFADLNNAQVDAAKGAVDTAAAANPKKSEPAELKAVADAKGAVDTAAEEAGKASPDPAAAAAAAAAALRSVLLAVGFKPKDDVFTKDKGAGSYIAYYITNEKCNVWDVTKHSDHVMTGGKKRITNRRKHRRSNRKTLGRKK